MKHVKVVILLCTFLTTKNNSVLGNHDEEHMIHRLPNTTVPHHYKIKLIPYIILDNFTFDGQSDIFLEVLKPTKNIILNSAHLTFRNESTELSTNEERFLPSQHVIDKERQFLILSFEKELQPGNYTLHLQYYGNISLDYKNAFYISSYENDNGEITFLATTHFETNHARRAFPCWDEPALKATFEISIKHFPNYTALSNMPVKKIINDIEIDGKLWTDFETTPLMSTYLICFVISDFRNISNNYGNFSVWSRNNALDSVRYMYDIGMKILPVLEEYTNISYAFPKLDNIAIPQTPSRGTENWGLITYRESEVLNNEKSTISHNLSTTMLVAHEFSHQWFGNLVGPAWWNDLWLSEGFARYMQYIVVDKVMCNERIKELAVIKITYLAFRMDSFSSEYLLPVSPNVKTKTELSLIFFPITYEKGASLLHMLSNILSEDIFHVGVVKYLQANQFKTATADNLWKSMQEALKEANVSYGSIDIKKIMDPYIYQIGYPTINVVRNYTTGLTTLTQNCVAPCKDLNTNHKWWVPINFATNTTLNFSATLPTHWMNPEKGEDIIIEGIDVDDWIIVNLQQSAYYRVNYDKTNWKKIVNYLNTENFSKIHVLNRAQLINDAIYFYEVKAFDFRILLELISYLIREVDYLPWIPALDVFDRLSRLFQNSSVYPVFKLFGLRLMNALITDVGFENRDSDSLFTSLKRNDAFRWICHFGHDQCVIKAKAYLLEYVKNNSTEPIPSDFEDWVICKGLEEANETIWNKVLDIYKETKSWDLMHDLACVKNETILLSYLEMTSRNDSVLPEDHKHRVIHNVFEKNADLALNFFVDNFNKVKLVLNDTKTINGIVNKMIKGIKTTTQLDKIKQFLNQNLNFIGNDTAANLIEHESYLKIILQEKISTARIFFEEQLHD